MHIRYLVSGLKIHSVANKMVKRLGFRVRVFPDFERKNDKQFKKEILGYLLHRKLGALT